ncbi:MAG: DNA-processing protein DprA [Planctomycetota bacterium]
MGGDGGNAGMEGGERPRLLGRRSPLWPPEVDHVADPPEELWIRGRAELLLRRPRVAIVGTRSPTPYGEAQAERFAGFLAERGIAVVSGLARGIDQRAHAAALAAGGATVAVLGSGVDCPWPAGELSRRIARDGVLVSEHAPGEPPRRHHFPLRNRLIAGLAAAVVVVEAAYASGSLITARWAADQGKGVFAIPGRVDHPLARGCHRLLREGASLLEDPAELLAELGLSPPPDERGAPAPASPLLRALVGETLSAEELGARLGLPLPAVLVALVRHELDGEVVRVPGGLYRLPSR